TKLETSLDKIKADRYIVYLEASAVELNRYIISASKFKEKKEDVPQKIEVIDRNKIQFYAPQNSADLMNQSGQMMVQKSQQGGGSPIIRGFESNRILLVIDGVRMNNAIYRGGHLQNILRIDPNMLEKAEIVYGPGSVIYGSDAFGGVIHFRTLDPSIVGKGNSNYTANAWSRYSSANTEMAFGAQATLSKGNWASATSISYTNFGDLISGKNGVTDENKHWQRTYYTARENNRDTMLLNSDKNKQVTTGYTQYDLLQKIKYRSKNGMVHSLNIQYSATGDVPRYDRLTNTDSMANAKNKNNKFAVADPITNKFSNAEWYYGPEKRTLISYQLQWKKSKKLFDELMITPAMQMIEESRHNRGWQSANKTSRIEKVNVYSINADLQKKIKKNELRYGVEFVYNDVNSTAFRTNVKTGEKLTTPVTTRYPGGGSNMSYTSAYITNAYEASKKLIFTQGLRYTYNQLHANFSDTSVTKFPFTEASQQYGAVSGSVGMVYKIKPQSRITFNISRGYRAPNIDDMGRVFDSDPKSKLLVVPNIDAKPEYTWNFDMGIYYTYKNILKVEFNPFYTLLSNALRLQYSSYNGVDSLLYDGKMIRTQSYQNTDKGAIYGFNINAAVQVYKKTIIEVAANYTKGEFYVNGSTIVADHIAPFNGRLALKNDFKKVKSELNVQFSAAKKLADYSPSGEDNYDYATLSGMPAWYTINYRISYSYNKNINLIVFADNITDKLYRVFASGTNAAGRNIGLRLNIKL
ncbi:MAG: TonB-dependent receptor, partial [Bacteroidetes bacterium]|nr:TonB-dependent receptor [Bacteroidota bacterium]